MELLGEAPPENEEDDNVVLPLFTSDYDSNDDSGEKYEDIYTHTQ